MRTRYRLHINKWTVERTTNIVRDAIPSKYRIYFRSFGSQKVKDKTHIFRNVKWKWKKKNESNRTNNFIEFYPRRFLLFSCWYIDWWSLLNGFFFVSIKYIVCVCHTWPNNNSHNLKFEFQPMISTNRLVCFVFFFSFPPSHTWWMGFD